MGIRVQGHYDRHRQRSDRNRRKEQKYQKRDPVPRKAETRREWRETIHYWRRQIADEKTVENYGNQAHARTAHIRDPQNRKQRGRNHDQQQLPRKEGANANGAGREHQFCELLSQLILFSSYSCGNPWQQAVEFGDRGTPHSNRQHTPVCSKSSVRLGLIWIDLCKMFSRPLPATVHRREAKYNPCHATTRPQQTLGRTHRR